MTRDDTHVHGLTKETYCVHQATGHFPQGFMHSLNLILQDKENIRVCDVKKEERKSKKGKEDRRVRARERKERGRGKASMKIQK